ncbi:MAG: acetylglutamate kinase [Candidatus Margulisbacteria bacterium]|nr:acetylglutamate kinase [Candidatus Margulisiibacteriota bacterium]
MINKYIEKAKVLLEALPYIQKFSGKTVVIKYGGSAMEDEKLKESVITDIVLLKYVGINPVIVHGGGIEITEWLKKVGIESKFIDGQRVTTKESMEVIEMVLSGKINKSIVNLINSAGGKAVGLCGKDAQLIEAKKYTEQDLGLVGEITNINADIIKILEESGHIPVISSIGFDKQGNSYNINADYAATDIAIALQAEKLIVLSNVDGILDKDKNLIKQLTQVEIKQKIKDTTISGGMIPKVNSLLKAIENGVHNVHIISGVIEHSILLELFTDYGIGTMIKS